MLSCVPKRVPSPVEPSWPRRTCRRWKVVQVHQATRCIASTGGQVTTGDIKAQIDDVWNDPPGTGKTYTGGRMIRNLVAQGLTVGVVSNSHRAVEKANADRFHEAVPKVQVISACHSPPVQEEDEKQRRLWPASTTVAPEDGRVRRGRLPVQGIDSRFRLGLSVSRSSWRSAESFPNMSTALDQTASIKSARRAFVCHESAIRRNES